MPTGTRVHWRSCAALVPCAGGHAQPVLQPHRRRVFTPGHRLAGPRLGWRQHPALRLAAVHNAKITGSAVPGETLLLEAEVAGRMDSLVQIEGRVRVGSRLVLTTRLTLCGSGLPHEDRLEDKPLVPMPVQEIRHHRNP